MNKNLFSIVIPTRQRHDTLRHSIQSVLDQTYSNLELVVMDNFSTRETYDLVHSFDDERIKYFRSDAPLGLHDNWELGLSHATGDYIFLLGDDDALLPDGLELVNHLLERYPVKIVSWYRHQYWWPNSQVESNRNRLFLGFNNIAFVRNCRQVLEDFYDKYFMFEYLPMIYNSFVHKSIINNIKSINGYYFSPCAPDVASGIVNAYFEKEYIYSYRSISIAGLSKHSTGTSQGHASKGTDGLKKAFANSQLDAKNLAMMHHDKLTESANLEISVGASMLMCKERFFSEDGSIELNIKNLLKFAGSLINRDPDVYERTLSEIEEIAKKHNINLSELNIPDKFNGISVPYQGPVIRDGHVTSLIINCEQMRIDNVCDASKVAHSIYPHYENIQVHDERFTLNNESLSQLSIPIIAIDGVFFQLYSTGIARVWKSLLEEWANTEFGNHLVVLDRVGTAPKIEGISYYQIPAYDYNNTDADREMLQQVCDELGAELFISTYYTTPLETPSVFMGYDMIPEVLSADLNQPMWQEKQRGIAHASAFLTISEHTAKDLLEYYPEIDPSTVTPALCGVQPVFKPAQPTDIEKWSTSLGITKPYFLLVGAGGGYKNTILFWQGFAQLANNGDFDIVCTGAAGIDAEEYSTYAPGSQVHCLQLDDRSLNLAYAGAIALVYPSKYEGFGLPIVEALASGCPVITCHNASIPEVAGTSAIYIDDTSIEEMTQALTNVQQPEIREPLIAQGLVQSQKFSWGKMAGIIQSVLLDRTLAHLQLHSKNLIIFPDWSADEEELGEELSQIFERLAQDSDSEQMTLLIDTSNGIDPEAANMLVSTVAMNIMMSADIDITEQFDIAFTGELAPIQWQALLPKLQGRIKLNLEDDRSILKVRGYANESSSANLISEIQLSESPALTLV